MRETMTIAKTYCGPANSGNGGYVAGRVAALIGEAAEVTLRQPPPLGQELDVERLEDGGVRIVDGDAVIAEARPAEPEVAPPPPVGFDTALAATDCDRHVGNNVFSRCFVCGPDRVEGDGLRVFAGPVSSDGMLAAAWVPHENFGDRYGHVLTEYIWSALDCPSGFAASGGEFAPMLLGRIVGRVSGRLRVGDEAVVMAWRLGREGRKHHAASALFAATGECVGLAQSVWIEPRATF